jgi:hypothetical protein
MRIGRSALARAIEDDAPGVSRKRRANLDVIRQAGIAAAVPASEKPHGRRQERNAEAGLSGGRQARTARRGWDVLQGMKPQERQFDPQAKDGSNRWCRVSLWSRAMGRLIRLAATVTTGDDVEAHATTRHDADE